MNIVCCDVSVIVIEEFLGVMDYQKVRSFAAEVALPYDQFTMRWHSDIVRGSSRIRISRPYQQDKPPELLLFESRLRALELPIFKQSFEAFTFLVYEGQRGSYVPMHRDGHVNFALTYYLNDTWESSWGGELLWSRGAAPQHTGQWISPKKDRLVIISNDVSHKTSIVSPDADPRLTIQGFAV